MVQEKGQEGQDHESQRGDVPSLVVIPISLVRKEVHGCFMFLNCSNSLFRQSINAASYQVESGKYK